MNVTDKDDGTYTCIVNTTLDSVSASAVLTVVGKNTLNFMIVELCLTTVKYETSIRFKMKSTNIVLVSRTGQRKCHLPINVFQFFKNRVLP